MENQLLKEPVDIDAGSSGFSFFPVPAESDFAGHLALCLGQALQQFLVGAVWCDVGVV